MIEKKRIQANELLGKRFIFELKEGESVRLKVISESENRISGINDEGFHETILISQIETIYRRMMIYEII